MKLAWLASCCALLAFAAVNVSLSLLAALAWRARRADWTVYSASRLFFWRAFPAAVSTALVVLVFVPSFLAHEPRESVEAVGVLLGLGAGAGLLVATAGVIRGITAWRRTRSVLTGLVRRARPIVVPGWPGPAYVVDGPFAGVSVVGWIRPKLLFSRSLFDACTEIDVAGIVAHERAHVSARDNLKRAVLRWLPDVLVSTGTALAIERAWEARAEEEADDAALRGGRVEGLDLAGALLKAARLARVPRAPLSASSLHAGGPIERRVRRLVGGAGPRARAGGHEWSALGLAMLVVAVVCGAVPDLSLRVHQWTERVVQVLAGF